MKILDLVLTYHWYDMIESGEKKEEYREIKPYWKRRLIEQPMDEDSGHVFFRDYDYVCFHRGYTSTTMIFTVREISMGVGKPEWGAPTDRPVFIIKLGERLLLNKIKKSHEAAIY